MPTFEEWLDIEEFDGTIDKETMGRLRRAWEAGHSAGFEEGLEQGREGNEYEYDQKRFGYFGK